RCRDIAYLTYAKSPDSGQQSRHESDPTFRSPHGRAMLTQPHSQLDGDEAEILRTVCPIRSVRTDGAHQIQVVRPRPILIIRQFHARLGEYLRVGDEAGHIDSGGYRVEAVVHLPGTEQPVIDG